MCDHDDGDQRQTLDDEIICVTCGEVLYKYETDSQGNFVLSYESSSNYQNNDNACDYQDFFKYYQIKDELQEIFEKAHIPMCILERVIKLYMEEDEKDFSKISFKNKKMELLCYATFIIMIEEKIPRTPAELAYFFGINSHSIWKLQKKNGNDSTVSPSDLLERYFDILNIPFKLLSDCSNTIETLKKISGVKPETMTACSLYVLGKKYEIKSLTYLCISKTCGVSVSSIRNLYKNFSKAS
jgi:transcription initiation factor TFIIIB Brf1 subunit/transcription initiation factor TFIIB